MIEHVPGGDHWWFMYQTEVHTPIHILPGFDSGQHFMTDECHCGSHINEDGNVVHMSFDGREDFELGIRKVS